MHTGESAVMYRTFILGLQFLCILLFGTVGYMFLGGGSFLDSLYMTVITVTTVGFEEVVPLGPGGRLFTIVLILVGVGFVLYVIGMITETVVEGGIRRIFGRFNMEKRIAALQQHYIICGYGRIGKVICDDLAHSKRDFVVIDRDPAEIAKLQEAGYLYIEGDATDDRILEKAGIQRARGLVAVVDTDAANVYIILSARGLNADLFILARASSEEKAETKLLRAGADKVISPYVIGASRMAQLLVRPTVCDFIDLTVRGGALGLRLEEMIVGDDSPLCDVNLIDSGIRREFDLIVVAIKRRSGEMTFNPAPQTVIQAGDTLIVLGEYEQIKKLEQKL